MYEIYVKIQSYRFPLLPRTNRAFRTALSLFLPQAWLAVSLLLLNSVCTAALTPAKLIPSDGQLHDDFGTSVAAEGDLALIGARYGRAGYVDAGAVYVFVRDANGNWIEQSKLTATDAALGDSFGYRISLSGSTAVITAPRDDDNGDSSGSAYVFVRNNSGGWIQQAKLLASDGVAGDLFGSSVSLDGNAVVIGAPGTSVTSSTAVGAAYVFERDASGNWAQQAKIQPGDGLPLDFVGGSVSLVGNTLIVGAPGQDINGLNIGSAYIYARDSAGSWAQQDKFVPFDAGTTMVNAGFGESVLLLDGLVAIGAPRGDAKNSGSAGSVYIFSQGGSGKWTQKEKIGSSDKFMGSQHASWG